MITVWADEDCSDGYYLSGDGKGWYPCHTTCKTCTQANECTTCEDYMLLDGGSSLCIKWGDGEYMDTTYEMCRDWDGKCSGSCAYQLECFEWPTDQILDLSTLECLTSCDAPNVLLNDDQFAVTNVCRSLDLYVDPESSELMELGTKQYPYRHFRAASSEILNHYSFTDANIKIHLKEGTRVYVEIDTTYFLSMGMVNITSYSDSNDYSGKALVVQTSIPQPQTSGQAVFHLLKNTDIITSDKITVDNYEPSLILRLGRKRIVFKIVTTNYTLWNIDFYSEQVDYHSDSVVSYLYMLQNRNIVMSKL